MALLPSTNESAGFDDDEDDQQYTDEEETEHVQEKVLVPGEVMHGRAQVVLVRVPEQPLQPPDGPVERLCDLVRQETAVLSSAVGIRGISEHLGEGVHEPLLGQLLELNSDTESLTLSLSGIGRLITKHWHGHYRFLVAESLLDAGLAAVGDKDLEVGVRQDLLLRQPLTQLDIGGQVIHFLKGQEGSSLQDHSKIVMFLLLCLRKI